MHGHVFVSVGVPLGLFKSSCEYFIWSTTLLASGHTTPGVLVGIPQDLPTYLVPWPGHYGAVTKREVTTIWGICKVSVELTLEP